MELDNNHIVILYDGDCGFCNFWVKWILKIDKKNQFYFAALQSPYGQAFLRQYQLPNTTLDTIYLRLPNGQFYTKLDAIIKIGVLARGPLLSLSILYLLPKFLRNKIYDFIAKRRQKIMSSHCYLPTAAERKRFIQ